jgi:hypothetical protein
MPTSLPPPEDVTPMRSGLIVVGACIIRANPKGSVGLQPIEFHEPQVVRVFPREFDKNICPRVSFSEQLGSGFAAIVFAKLEARADGI